MGDFLTDRSTASPNERQLYLEGSCHVLALALHRKYGMSFLVVSDPEQPYWIDPADADNFIPSVVHVYAVDAGAMAWDVLGSRPRDLVLQELQSRHPDIGSLEIDEVGGPLGLTTYVDGMGKDIDRPLHSVSQADLDQAAEVVERVIGHLLPARTPSP